MASARLKADALLLQGASGTTQFKIDSGTIVPSLISPMPDHLHIPTSAAVKSYVDGKIAVITGQINAILQIISTVCGCITLQDRIDFSETYPWAEAGRADVTYLKLHDQVFLTIQGIIMEGMSDRIILSREGAVPGDFLPRSLPIQSQAIETIAGHETTEIGLVSITDHGQIEIVFSADRPQFEPGPQVGFVAFTFAYSTA